MFLENRKKMNPTKLIVYGYLIIILLGGFLLTLPISSRSGEFTPFIDAVFTSTSTSATCVTGLVVQDTYTYWSGFGQAVILALIQVGGIGFMTLGIAVITLTKRKIGLGQRYAMQESVAAPQVGGIVRMTKFIVSVTAVFEGVGMVLLATVFCPMAGFWKGIYLAAFHSISAFCNAGFDLMGFMGKYSSLTAFESDPLVNIVIMVLIVVGGLGFFVWSDVFHNRLHFRQYRLHSKIVIVTTAVLIIGGALLILIFEQKGAVFEGRTAGEQVLISLFQSITPRTAGYNTVDMTLLAGATKMLIICLMLIGGSPGSTAGGMKTTTFTVLFLSIIAEYKKQKSIEGFNRRVDNDTVRHAACVMMLYLILPIAASMVISGTELLPIGASLFEAASAIGTVGLSLGITPELGGLSEVILILLMFFGRVGGITLILLFADKVTSPPSQMPLERISIG